MAKINSVKTTREVMKSRSCPTFRESDDGVNLKGSTQQAHVKKDAHSFDGFCGHCNNVFEAL